LNISLTRTEADETPGTKIKLLVLLVVWLVAYYPVYPILVKTWFDKADNSHGALVPLVALYLIWRKWDALQSAEISTSKWGLILLAGSLGVYLLSFLGAIAYTMNLAMVVSLSGIVLYLFGSQVFRILWFPLLFLIFMIPIPDSLEKLVSFPLQLWATQISADLIGLFSIPVYREGNMLYFEHSQLEVAEACSGLRAISSLVMLSSMFASIMSIRWSFKALIIFSAIPIALIANVVRISGTGFLAHYWGSEMAFGFMHQFSGIVVFVFGLVMMLLAVSLIQRVEKKGYRVNRQAD
jgi:exosortase